MFVVNIHYSSEHCFHVGLLFVLTVQKELPALTSIVADPFSLPSLGYVNPVPPFPVSLPRFVQAVELLIAV